MTLIKKYLLIIPFAAGIVFWIYQNRYVEFEATVFEHNTFRTIKQDSTFLSNLKVVLIYYKESYRTNKDGGVLIKHTLKMNYDLMHNYTQKALDTSWINSHHVPAIKQY